ncbi:hypothetical protein ACOMHN_062698 [Nucella lapillus]
MNLTGVGTVCVWIWAVVFVVHGQHYVNVATGKTYNQSSLWSTELPSSHAANGDTGGTFSSANCIHTKENGDLNPWWEVDLGQPYPVYNIDLWARAVLKGQLYPSNITVDNKTCAEVTTFPSDTRELTVTCSAIMKGRKVRITRQGNTGESNRDRVMNMCEMEIYVCTDGWYGQQCSTRCSQGCQNTVCDRQSAQCSPCNAGYTEARCAECVDRYYKTSRSTCISCSSNCLNQLCDKTSGRCNGCVTGRYGDQCSTRCPTGCLGACDQQSSKCASCEDGWYGDQCSTRCPTGCQNACDQQSGKCVSCKDEWYGHKCSTPCSTGCLNDRCLQSGPCSSCKAGYTGSTCSECVDRYYKTNSSTCTSCSSNCLNPRCDKTSGRCNDGLHGDQCSTRCPTGCLNACDQQSGKCASCKDGWYGDQCSNHCPTGCLNDRCLQSELCSSCKAGYTGSTCSGGGRVGNNLPPHCLTRVEHGKGFSVTSKQEDHPPLASRGNLVPPQGLTGVQHRNGFSETTTRSALLQLTSTGNLLPPHREACMQHGVNHTVTSTLGDGLLSPAHRLARVHHGTSVNGTAMLRGEGGIPLVAVQTLQ